jgi:MoaA/NifB/PqqE/SkfB family radical SAM enzyme
MNKINLTKSAILGVRYPSNAFNLLKFEICKKKNILPEFDFPIIVRLSITEKCNLKCPMCLIWKSRDVYKNNKDLTMEDWAQVIKEIGRNNSMVSIMGGEPLLSKDLFQIISQLKKERILCGITTNGVLLKEHANQLVNSGIDFISVSLDGPKEIHDKSRGINGTYDKVIIGLKELVKYRKSNLFPNIKINCVISRDNVYLLEEIISIANSVGIDEVSFQHLSFFNEKIENTCNQFASKKNIEANITGMKLSNEPLNNDEIIFLNKFQNNISYFEKKYGLKISFKPSVNNYSRYYSFDFPSKKSICYNPWMNVKIRSDGTMEICDGFSVGNVRESSIKELFNSNKVEKLRSHVEQNKLMPFCFRCCNLDFYFDEN